MLTSETLILLPCSGSKRAGGQKWRPETQQSYGMAPDARAQLIRARGEVLRQIRGDSRYYTNKYQKNAAIKRGPDVGGAEKDGEYLAAIDRYSGRLYSVTPGFAAAVRDVLCKHQHPKVLILSALYGPVHPLELIQDYNLKMSDRPALSTWTECFPSLLEAYISLNGIKHMQLYVGQSTPYFKVAARAAKGLLRKGLLQQAIQFEVNRGNTYDTTYNHGLLVAWHLGIAKDVSLTRRISESVL